MSNLSRSKIRRLVIQEHYRTSLIQQLYEQTEPAPADPSAPAEDPAAPADPASTSPTAPAAPPATDTPAPLPDPTAAAPAIDPTAAATPAADPTIAAATSPIPAPTLSASPSIPAIPAITPPVAGLPAPAGATPAPAPGTAPKPKPAAKPGTAASEVDKAGQAAIKAGEDSLAKESLRRRSLRFLIEQSEEGPNIDIGTYAGKLANLIQNYTSLVDVKKNVIDQAEKFLDDQFPKNAEALKKQLKDLLRKDYHISLERPEPPSDSYAVGAKSGGGGAA